MILFGALWWMTPLFAQSNENKEAPQILTTDLVRRQKVETGRLDVSFVIYDSDAITEVRINGEAQDFAPSNTININKSLEFKKGKNLITVVAVDEKGNQQTRRFLVAYGVELEPEASEKKDSKIYWKIVGDIQQNTDSNPNNDLGLPIDTGDITLEGQIADDEQSDTQTVVNLMGIVGYGNWSGFFGISQSKYSKEIYEPINSSVMILGGGHAPPSSEDGINARLMMLDITLGDEAFAVYQILNVGYQFGRQDKEDGTTRHLWRFVLNSKAFADSSLDPGSANLVEWVYTNMDAEKLDFFKSVIAVGSGNDGTEESSYSIYGFDFDWSNKWESGLLQGTGFGLHYKEYPNQEALSEELGDSRIDVPFRFSFHLGWAFTQDWMIKANYDYKINISTKNPSYKTVTGLQLKGGF